MHRWMKGLLICVISLQIVGFNACRQSSLSDLAPKQPVTIDFWHYYQDEKSDQLEQLVDTFNQSVGKEKQIVVQISSQGSIDQLSEQLLTMVDSGRAADLPDLFSAYPDLATDLHKRTAIADINQYMSEADLEVFPESYLDEGKICRDQKIFLLPLAKASEVVALNDTVWQAFTTEYPRFVHSEKTFSSWEQILAAAQAYHHWSDGEALMGFDSLANFIIIGNRQLGVDLFEYQPNGGKIILDREAMRQIWSVYYGGTVTGYFGAWQTFRSEDLAEGSLAAAVISTSAGHYLPQEVSIGQLEPQPVDFKILPYPVFAEGEPYSVHQGAGLAISRSDSDHEIAAAVFLQWLTRPEQNIAFSIDSGYLPVTKPALQSQLLRGQLEKMAAEPSEEQLNMICLNTFLEQMETHQLYAPQAFSGSFAARKIISQSLADFTAEARTRYLYDLESGESADRLYDRYVNDAVFEQWYSELIVAVERLENS